MTIAISFAQVASQALAVADDSLDDGFDRVQADYKQGWVDYRSHLFPIPAAALPVARHLRDEPARAQGPRGQGQPGRVRRQPEHAVGLGRAEDRRGQPAQRARTTSSGRATSTRSPRRCSRPATRTAPTARSTSCSTNSSATTARSRRTPRSTGSASGRASRWTSRACRSCSPTSSAARARPTGSTSARPPTSSSRKGPNSEQERWENQEGYSPGTIAAEIAGLICAADIARKNGSDGQGREVRDQGRRAGSATSSAGRRPATAPTAEAVLPAPDQEPQARQGHQVRDRRLRPVEDRPAPGRRRLLPRARPARRQAPDDPVILNTLQVVDAKLKAGNFWHRFSFDGYGEQRDGGAVASVR